MLIVLAELKVSVSNCEKMSHKIASRLRFSRANGTYWDVRTSSHHIWANCLTQGGEYQKRFRQSVSAYVVACLAVVTLIKDC